jgi:DNA-binding XRE family transcriptional regulator
MTSKEKAFADLKRSNALGRPATDKLTLAFVQWRGYRSKSEARDFPAGRELGISRRTISDLERGAAEPVSLKMAR